MNKFIKIGETKGHTGPIYDASLGKSKDSIFTCSGDRFLAEWDLKTMSASPFSVRLEQPCFAIEHDQERNLLLLGNSLGGIHLIDLKASKELRLLQVHEKGVFSFLRVKNQDDKVLLLSGGGAGKLQVWEYPEMNLHRTIVMAPSKIRCIEALEDGKIFVGQSNGMATIMDDVFFNTLAEWKAHEGGVFSLLNHPKKKVLISGGKDGHLRLWKKDNFEEVLAIPAHNFGIYDLKLVKNKYLVSASRDKTLALWDVDSMDLLHRARRPQINMHTHSINTLVWNEELEVLVSAGDDRRIIFWKIDENA